MIVNKIKIGKNNDGPDIPEGLEYSHISLNPDGNTYTVYGVRSIRGVPFRITQIQGLLSLENLGKLQQVRDMVEKSGSGEIKIYFEYAPYWERISPLVEQFGEKLGMDQQEVDKFFENASKLNC